MTQPNFNEAFDALEGGAHSAPAPAKSNTSLIITGIIAVTVLLVALIAAVAVTSSGGDEKTSTASTSTSVNPNSGDSGAGNSEAGDALVQTMFDSVWADTSYSDQEAMCGGWGIIAFREELLDSFMDGLASSAAGDAVSRERARAFFDEKCL